MNEAEKGSIYDLLKLIGFSMYFVLLFFERLFALVFSPTRGGEYALCAQNVFNYVAYAVTASSLAVGTILFLRLFARVFACLRVKERYDFDRDAGAWCFASAALLFGGMMHTGQTVAWVQFIAYGFLIGAMIVRCVEACAAGESKVVTITSTVYLTLFSMSIPVCYISFLCDPQRILFFVSEYAAVFALVPIFGVMLSALMRTGKTSFSPIFPAVMAVLSGATLALGWSESVNTFVLIFASATLVCYLTVGLLARRKLRGVPPSDEEGGCDDRV